eukprot:SAG22_NODE_541_length_9297_cov_9.387149_6_plen_111_part_00
MVAPAPQCTNYTYNTSTNVCVLLSATGTPSTWRYAPEVISGGPILPVSTAIAPLASWTPGTCLSGADATPPVAVKSLVACAQACEDLKVCQNFTFRWEDFRIPLGPIPTL